MTPQTPTRRETPPDQEMVTFVLSDGGIMKIPILRHALGSVFSIRREREQMVTFDLNSANMQAATFERDDYDIIETRGRDGRSHWIALPHKMQERAL